MCVSTGRHHSRPQNFLLAVLNLCWVKPQMLKVTLHNQYQTTIKPASGSSPSAMHPYASSYPGQLALVWLLSTPFSCQTIPEAVVVDSVVYEAFIEEAVTKNYGNPARELSCLVCWGERRSGTCSQRSWLSWVSTMDFVRERCGGGHGQRKQQERRQSSESGGTEGQGDLPQDFPSGPVAKTPRSQCRGPGFDPWSRN